MFAFFGLLGRGFAPVRTEETAIQHRLGGAVQLLRNRCTRLTEDGRSCVHRVVKPGCAWLPASGFRRKGSAENHRSDAVAHL